MYFIYFPATQRNCWSNNTIDLENIRFFPTLSGYQCYCRIEYICAPKEAVNCESCLRCLSCAGFSSCSLPLYIQSTVFGCEADCQPDHQELIFMLVSANEFWMYKPWAEMFKAQALCLKRTSLKRLVAVVKSLFSSVPVALFWCH